LNNDSLGQIACTKHRRAGKNPPSVIKVDGEFGLVTSPTNYQVDNKGQIVDKDSMTTAGLDAETFLASSTNTSTGVPDIPADHESNLTDQEGDHE
jgi:hypothetical protein